MGRRDEWKLICVISKPGKRDKKGGRKKKKKQCGCDFDWRTFFKFGRPIISIICEELAKSLVVEMSPVAQRQTNTALISSLKQNDNHQPCVFVMNGN